MKEHTFSWEKISLVDFAGLASCHLKKFNPNTKDEQGSDLGIDGDEAWNLMLLNAEKSQEMNHLSSFFNDKLEPARKTQKFNFGDVRIGTNIQQILPKVTLCPEMFMQQRIRLFKYLHLLYEDLRLISQRSEERENLCYFLLTYTIFLNVEQSENYQHYYLQEYPSFLTRIENDEPLQLLLKLLKEHNGSNSKVNLVGGEAGTKSAFNFGLKTGTVGPNTDLDPSRLIN